jgi:hypothetical protein
MSSWSLRNSSSATLLVLGLVVGAAAPLGISASAKATSFVDVQSQGVSAPTSSRIEASNYVVQVSTGNNQATNNSSSSQTVSNKQTSQTSQYKVPKGTIINIDYKVSDKVVVYPGETQSLTLTVAKDIKNSKGEILIPKDSEIEGEIVPRYNGSSFLGAQFVAQRLIVRNQSYSNLNATSLLLTGQQSRGGLQQTIRGAAINTAAQVLLGRVTGRGSGVGDILGRVGGVGDILGQVGNAGDILGQVGSAGDILSGVLTGRDSKRPQQNGQIVIDPDKDLQLTVGSDFYVNTITKAPNYSVQTY